MADFARLENLFFGALAKTEPTERQRYLDVECGQDADLREQVERLLAGQVAAGSFLQKPAAPEATQAYAAVSEKEPELLGTQVGPYKLLQKLGEGGMGTVWVAEQEKPVKRRVALKLIKAGMDSAQVLRRFEAERQALALMDHTNIAKVLDAGTAASGRPYFVMELVKGVPITKYCDEVHASIKNRLDLFVQVCSAVQHAHQKGIIHRDIKPSNILIAMQDGKPVPKVIDFGVAKALHSKLADQTMYTEIGQIIGTLEYMAPEQAELSAMDIDTRADIYALGVLLYELLTGSTPITRERMKSAAFAEVIRLIKEEDPPKPSTRLTQSKESLASLAALRKTDPKHLSAELKGELDWVVLKALEKDRTCRYETANGLARDIQRYLADEVVEARPPSAGYRMRKFVRRNKGQVIAATLVLFALVAGIAGTTLGMWRANAAAEAERRAKLEADEQKEKALLSAERELEERMKAQAKEAEANAVVKFFEDQVFSAARPKGQDGGLGAAVLLRDAITASLPALDKTFTEQPLVEARLRMALGKTYFYLAEHEQAREQDERARALYTQHLGPEHTETLRSMVNQANNYDALNRQADALKMREEVLAIQKRVLPRDHSHTLTSMNNLASSYAALNRHAEASKLYGEVLEIQLRVLPKDHPNTLLSMHNLASSYDALNRPAEALKLREEVLEIRKRVLPKDHPDTLKSMHNLAISYDALNRPAEALKLREEVLEIQLRVLPKDHPNTLQSMNNLALSYAALNRQAEASKLYEEVLEIQLRVLPKDHPNTLLSMNNLANSYAALNRHSEALKLQVEVLEIQKRVLPKDHPSTLSSMNNLANIYAALNRHSEALKLQVEVLEIQKRVLPKDHPHTLVSMNNLAISYYALNRHSEALKVREEVLEIRKRVLLKDHPDTLASMVNLGASLIQLDRGAEAIPLIDVFIAKGSSNPAVDPRLVPYAFSLRMSHFQKVGDPAGCRATAALWEKLNRTDADSLYTAACFRAITAAVQAKAPGADAARLAQDDADRAMEWLHQAVKAGYKDAAHMKKDPDLDFLRNRDDFKKLIAELSIGTDKK